MELQLVTTQMETTVGKWKLHLTRRDQMGSTVLWSVIRHPADKPKIPPMCEVLTIGGWVHALRAPSDASGLTLYVSESRLAEIAKETCA